MKFFGFVVWLTFCNFSVHLGNGFKYDALVIQKIENELRFVRASTDVKGLFLQYVSMYETKQLYYLCPKGPQEALYIKVTVQYMFGDAKRICSNEVEPTILKVEGEFENDEGRKDIHAYDIGFTVNDKKFTSVTSHGKYESIDEVVGHNCDTNNYLIPMITIYRDKKFQHTIAVKYDILTVDIRKPLNENLAQTYQDSPLFATKMEQLFLDQKSKLTQLLGENYIANSHVLVLDSLVNENDFIVDTWKKTTRYKVFQIPIWKENFQMWRNIREFVRNIASAANARKTIYAGIGKALTITGTDEQKYELQWNQGEDTAFIPELYWIAVNFTPTISSNEKTTGMFVIMHNEPTVSENNVKKICDTDACQTNGIWYIMEGAEKMKGRVYCCEMNLENISKLGANYLLKELRFFTGWKGLKFPPK